MTSLTRVPFGGACTYYVAGTMGDDPLPIGQWVGAGSAAQGLHGEVSFMQAASLFGDGDHPERDRIIADKLQAGWTPANAEQAAELGRQRAAFSGFDLTLRPVKTVSVLWALGGNEGADLVGNAHDKAVISTIQLLEKYALITREGIDGIAQLPLTQGVLAAGFRHYTSRKDNPEIHDHILLSSKAQNHHGHWKIIDPAHLNSWKEAIHEHYHSAVQRELMAKGIRFESRPVEDPDDEFGNAVTWEVAGIDDGTIKLFSDYQPCEGTGPIP